MAVKVGFIGTGGMAGAHMNTLKGFDDVEFVAMCDVVEEKAKARANEFGGKPFTDYKEMFDKVDMDAVYICTPPFAHGEQTRQGRVPHQRRTGRPVTRQFRIWDFEREGG